MKHKNEILNKITEYICKMEMIMGILLLCIITLISCKMPEIIEKEENTTEQKNEIKSNGITVVIDPGHGGVDPGKIGVNDVLEKDINLEIAQKLKEKLISEGYSTVMTRETDRGLYDENDSNKKRTDMRRRCELINTEAAKNKKTINISIHQNSYTSEDVKGPQVFYYSQSKPGIVLAEIVQDTINAELQIERPREEKANDNYYMLVHTDCPSVIVECGFLSNWEEAQLLRDEQYQKQLVDSIAKGVNEYYEQ